MTNLVEKACMQTVRIDFKMMKVSSPNVLDSTIGVKHEKHVGQHEKLNGKPTTETSPCIRMTLIPNQ
jgi:hypothetical protein